MTYYYQNQCEDACYSPCNYGTSYSSRTYEWGSPCSYWGYGSPCSYRDCYPSYSSRCWYPSRWWNPSSSCYTRRYSSGSCYPCYPC